MRAEGPPVSRGGSLRARPVNRRRPVGFGGALRSELTKIRTVRSTYWTLVATIGATVFIGAVTCVFTGPGQVGPGYDPTFLSLDGLLLAQLIIAVLGALTITSEYSTGMIRTSLGVLPRRGTVFAAKVAAFAIVAFAAGLIASSTSFWLGQTILNRRHLGTGLSQPHVLRAVIGAALFLTVSGLLALGFGFVFRYTAAAIIAAITVLFMTLILEAFVPDSLQPALDKWVPFNAGSQIWSTVSLPSYHQFSPWAGFAVFTAYAAVVLLTGLALFLRRDA